MTEKLSFNPTFVQTTNVMRFLTMMTELSLDKSVGRFAMMSSDAGLGKTWAAENWHCNNPSIYLLMQAVWASSPMGFLEALLKKLGHKINDLPRSQSRAFAMLLDALVEDPRPIFLDEVDLMPKKIIEIIRNLTDLTAAPVILIGEGGLPHLLMENARVWSRVVTQVRFEPLSESDVMLYAKKVAGMALSAEVGRIVHKASDGLHGAGNFRLIKNVVLRLVSRGNADGGPDGPAPITPEMAKLAVSDALTGR